MDQLPEGCGYLGYEFGAGSYPDSLCRGGKLYDVENLDNDGCLLDPMEDIPLPNVPRTRCSRMLEASI